MSNYINSPYKNIPTELIFRYNMNSSIPIFDWWDNGTKKNGVKWNDEYIESYCKKFTAENIRNNKEGESSYGNDVCLNLLNSFEKYNLRNKKIAIVGSETPWIEAMLLNMDNEITTIEYNVPESNYKNLECKDYFTYFEKNKNTFDVIVTFSSIEHSGLGRYGDPLDPEGDLKTMKVIHNNLKKDGILIWGAPVGADALVWNVHRIYGKERLKYMFNKFEELEWFSKYSKDNLLNRTQTINSYQPVIVLKKLTLKYCMMI